MQLVSYIAHAAPATRRPATGDEPYLRPELGFVPRWYAQKLGLDFGQRWHTDPAYRRDTIIAMADETRRRFGRRAAIGVLQAPDHQPLDLLTGTFGTLLVAGIYGVPIVYHSDDWPWAAPGPHLSDRDAHNLEAPSLDNNAFWNDFMGQVDWIAAEYGRVEGFMNWQGVLNNAYRLRGEQIFAEIIDEPQRARHVFACVAGTMIEGMQRLYGRQRESGVELSHCTVSNCLVNMLSPRQYEEHLLPFDQRIAQSFSMIGVHNCEWNADPYIDLYRQLPNVAYIDMGIGSDLARAREAFPRARRAIMYAPTDAQSKPTGEIERDLERVARDYGPCDVVFADMTDGTPDRRVHELIDICEKLSEKYESEGDRGRGPTGPPVTQEAQ
jgi:hypothetical protein